MLLLIYVSSLYVVFMFLFSFLFMFILCNQNILRTVNFTHYSIAKFA